MVRHKIAARGRVGATWLLIGCMCLTTIAAEGVTGAGWLETSRLVELRRQAAHRARRVIFNNDGCDCLYFPSDQAVTAENLLQRRTTGLANTQVDAIAYCTISSGFSNFTHHTAIGTILTHGPAGAGSPSTTRNIAQDLINQKTDCLAVMVDFARRQRMEIFWSMRMNDTHDAAHRPDQPYFLYPPLKAEHPDWLVGDCVRRTPIGRWSSVDYARPEIRELAYRYLEEVVNHYDVDGIELDFFRHPCFFRTVAEGGVATSEQCNQMTGLLRRVRQMTEQAGLRRGRPVLISIRVPDSVEYDRDLGLDLERWLQEGLVDLLITTCYFRLNPWSYSVELGHRYGVPVYPCLSDSRVTGESRFKRSSVESYRARAINAWAAGADGIHIFNLFDPTSSVFREAGDERALRSLDKLYFVTVRDGKPQQYLAGGEKYRRIPRLTPQSQQTLTVATPLDTTVTISEEVRRLSDQEPGPTVTCHLELPQLGSPDQVAVRFNGRQLTGGEFRDGWLDLHVPWQFLRRGENRVEAALADSASGRTLTCRDLVVSVDWP